MSSIFSIPSSSTDSNIQSHTDICLHVTSVKRLFAKWKDAEKSLISFELTHHCIRTMIHNILHMINAFHVKITTRSVMTMFNHLF